MSVTFKNEAHCEVVLVGFPADAPAGVATHTRVRAGEVMAIVNDTQYALFNKTANTCLGTFCIASGVYTVSCVCCRVSCRGSRRAFYAHRPGHVAKSH